MRLEFLGLNFGYNNFSTASITMNNTKNIFLIVFLVIFFSSILLFALWYSSQPQKGQSFSLEEKTSTSSQKNNGDNFDASEEMDESERLAREKAIREEDLKLFLEEPYSKLPIVTVPIIRYQRVFGMIHLRVITKSRNRLGFRLSKILMPRLIDAIFCDLYGAFYNLWIQDSEINPKVIQKRLLTVIQKAIGPEYIEEIYLKEFFFNKNYW